MTRRGGAAHHRAMPKRTDAALIETLKAQLVPPPPFVLPGDASKAVFAPLLELEAAVAKAPALKTIWREQGALGNACTKAQAGEVSAEVIAECTTLLEGPVTLGTNGPLNLEGVSPKARKELEREAAMIKERNEARLQLWKVVATFAARSDAGQNALAAVVQRDSVLADELSEPLARCGARATPVVEAMFLSWLKGRNVSHAAWWAARLAPERAFELLAPLCSREEEGRTTNVLSAMNGIGWTNADQRWLAVLEPMSQEYGFRSLTAVAVATLRARTP